jgi:hypothetical protein
MLISAAATAIKMSVTDHGDYHHLCRMCVTIGSMVIKGHITFLHLRPKTNHFMPQEIEV